MEIIEPGHIYQLAQLDDTDKEDHSAVLTFVNREKGQEHGGTQTQEVLRALIDRTKHCDNCIRWEGNDLIIHHLRMALVLHEARALMRKTVKGLLVPEDVITGVDGHFDLHYGERSGDADQYTYTVHQHVPSAGGLGVEA